MRGGGGHFGGGHVGGGGAAFAGGGHFAGGRHAYGGAQDSADHMAATSTERPRTRRVRSGGYGMAATADTWVRAPRVCTWQWTLLGGGYWEGGSGLASATVGLRVVSSRSAIGYATYYWGGLPYYYYDNAYYTGTRATTAT